MARVSRRYQVRDEALGKIHHVRMMLIERLAAIPYAEVIGNDHGARAAYLNISDQIHACDTLLGKTRAAPGSSAYAQAKRVVWLALRDYGEIQ